MASLITCPSVAWRVSPKQPRPRCQSCPEHHVCGAMLFCRISRSPCSLRKNVANPLHCLLKANVKCRVLRHRRRNLQEFFECGSIEVFKPRRIPFNIRPSSHEVLSLRLFPRVLEREFIRTTVLLRDEACRLLGIIESHLVCVPGTIALSKSQKCLSRSRDSPLVGSSFRRDFNVAVATGYHHACGCEVTLRPKQKYDLRTMPVVHSVISKPAMEFGAICSPELAYLSCAPA